MKGVKTTTVFALCVGALLVSSPAFAWTCRAKNAAGVTYTAVGIVRATVAARALAKCKASSAAPRTCYVTGCTLP